MSFQANQGRRRVAQGTSRNAQAPQGQTGSNRHTKKAN